MLLIRALQSSHLWDIPEHHNITHSSGLSAEHAHELSRAPQGLQLQTSRTIMSDRSAWVLSAVSHSRASLRAAETVAWDGALAVNTCEHELHRTFKDMRYLWCRENTNAVLLAPHHLQCV